MTAAGGPRRPPPTGDAEWTERGFVLAWGLAVPLPLEVLLASSFFRSSHFQTVYRPTFATWQEIFCVRSAEVAVRTLRIALTVTLLELLVGFPFALWLAKARVGKPTQAIILTLLTIPFFLDLSSRIIIWRAIFGENGTINSTLLALGPIDQPVSGMLYTGWSVHFGMLLTYFPLMVLPIYMAISVIDDSLIEASGDLGGAPAQTFVHVILPLALPGVVVGFVFTLGPSLAAWVEPSMLGGGFVSLLSDSVESAYTDLRYPVVAALSAFVIVLLALLPRCRNPGAVVLVGSCRCSCRGCRWVLRCSSSCARSSGSSSASGQSCSAIWCERFRSRC